VTDWQAQVGDAVSIGSHRSHSGGRRGEIVEVRSSPGGEYYRVRWEDGRESLFHPGADAVLLPKSRRRRKTEPAAERQRGSGAGKPSKDRQGPAEPHGLRANPGDRLVIHGHHLGEPERDGEILEALGEGGRPPFRVLWSDTGREALVFPGPDADVDHLKRRGKSAERSG
jgi:hypothetical protein